MGNVSYVILDDDIVFSLWLKKTIEQEFPEFDHISSRDNTLEGLFDVHRQQPTLLFLDQYIDGLNGFDVLDLMKYQPKTIMVSSEKIEQEQLNKYPNVLGFIEKPVDIKSLKKLILKSDLGN